MPPRDKRFQQADKLAGTMFNVFPQGVGERVSGAAQAVGGAIGSAINRFSNPFGALASDIGAARQAVSGTRLIGQRSPMTVPPTPMTTVLPSGTPMVGFDAYPAAPQSIPRTVEPFRGNASTEAAKKYEGLPPHLQTAVDRLNMSPQTTSVVDAARSPLSGINAPIDASVQGMDVNRSPIATRVPEMPSGMSTAPSFDLSGATQQTTPLLTNQVPEMPVNVAQAKTPIQTPYGTVYATAQQMGNERVSEMGGLPTQSARLENIGERARQSAAIKQMRERGAALNQERTDWVQNTIQQRRENPTAYTTPSGRSVAVPTNRFGQPLESWMNQLGNEGRLNYGPRPAPQTTSSTGSRSIPSPVNPSVLASTGFGAMQRAQQGSISQPLGGSPLFAGMGYTAAFGGGPQPARSMMAYNDQEDTRTRFRRTLGLV